MHRQLQLDTHLADRHGQSLGQPAMKVLSMAILVGIQAGVYLLILKAAARILRENRERIIARLAERVGG